MTPDSADDRVTRALLAQIRQQFDAPVGAIIGFAEILLEDATAQQAADLTPDLQRILTAGRQLRALVEALHAPAAGSGAPDPEAFRARLRHDLRTPLSAVKGYAEMLRDDAAERGLAGFVADLDRLLAAADGLLGEIARSTASSGSPRPARRRRRSTRPPPCRPPAWRGRWSRPSAPWRPGPDSVARPIRRRPYSWSTTTGPTATC